jgi:hypothetical protein
VCETAGMRVEDGESHIPRQCRLSSSVVEMQTGRWRRTNLADFKCALTKSAKRPDPRG